MRAAVRMALAAVLFLGTSRGFSAEPERAVTAENIARHYQSARTFRAETTGRILKAKIDPHWFGEGRFWYKNDLAAGKKEFVLVDAAKRSRDPAFDHARLAEGLAMALGKPVEAERLPFGEIRFADDLSSVTYECHGKRWKTDLASYETAAVEGPADEEKRPDNEKKNDEKKNEGPRRERERGSVAPSPDGRWKAEIENHNVFVMSNQDASVAKLSESGTAIRTFTGSRLHWSPNSKFLVSSRIEPGIENRVHLLESSAPGATKSKLLTRDYPQPGHRFPSYELWTFDIENKKGARVQSEAIDFHGPPDIRWSPDGSSFTYRKDDRGHQRVRIVRVDAATGQTKNIVDEKTQTFIDGTRIYEHWFEDGKELLWASERDGWRHLYLIDGETGAVKRQITRGPWVVRGVERVDEANRCVWISASGRHPDQDPYFLHHLRVPLGPRDDAAVLDAGSTPAGPAGEPVELTAGNGTHTIRFSPDRKYLIDSWSRVDLPPVTELRRAEDGEQICELERADISQWEATGWRPPLIFSAKGRDGVTDIWGHVFRPRKFDPTKSYPVVEAIYAGPHDSHVPKSFGPHLNPQELAELGFLVVQIDGMGTANRSRAFHDVCWKNLGDAGFADRILWLKALAAKYPYVDLSRIGIHGTSAGGYDSTRAMLAHPDFYKVAVSSCGNHDHRIDKQWWNEQWMGYPIGNHYREQSNITNAAKLRGKLMLIVGELDTNVPPESTYQLADALIKAGKDFELVMIPGMGHSSGGSYGDRKRRDFFVRHLHGVEPPAW